MPVLHNQKSPICFPLSTPAPISEAFLLCLAARACARMKNVMWRKETKGVAYKIHAKQPNTQFCDILDHCSEWPNVPLK